MRICIDASPAAHHRGGFGRYVQELTAGLLAVDPDSEYVAFYNHAAAARVDSPLDRLPHLITRLTNRPWRLSVMLAYLTRIRQDRLFPGIDIFHATDNLLPRLSQVKSVFALQDLIFRVYPETHNPPNRWFLTLMMPHFLRAANVVIAISECTSKDAVRLYGLDEAKIKVIYAGVSPGFHARGPEAISLVREKYGLPENFILFVGTIEPRKNLTTLLEAYHALKNEDTGCKLVIVGRKGWLYGGFFRKLRELGLEDEVLFPGPVPDEDLSAFYTAADLFVYPSLYEGFGLPVVEAMACGAPVITSNTSSLPEVAGEAALLVEPTSVEELLVAVRRLLNDKALQAEMAARGLKRAARFTWEETARRTAEVYREII